MKGKETDQISNKKPNFIFSGDFYKGELVELKFNDSLLLQEIVATDSVSLVSRYFILNFEKPFTVSLKTSYEGRVYLDTTFSVKVVASDSSYKVAVTHPHPYDWKKYYKDGVPSRNWGYLPIDSSLRFVHFSTF